MKLILENWREYLNEEEEILSWEDWTVADLQELIDMGRKGESKQAQSLLKRLLGAEALKLIPYLGQALTAGEMIQGYYNKLKRAPEGPDAPEDFPALAILDIDPELVRVVEDDILNRVDERYQEYLSGLAPDTKLSEVLPINDFIRQEIARDTGRRVVIRDETE